MQKEKGTYVYVPPISTLDVRSMDDWTQETIGIVVPNSNAGAQNFTITDTSSGLSGVDNQRYSGFYASDGMVYCFPNTVSDMRLYVLNAQTGATLETIELGFRGMCEYSHDLNVVFVSLGDTTRMFDLGTRTVTDTIVFPFNTGPVTHFNNKLYCVNTDEGGQYGVYEYDLRWKTLDFHSAGTAFKQGCTLVVGRYGKLWGIAKNTSDVWNAVVFDPQTKQTVEVQGFHNSTVLSRTARGLLFLDDTLNNGAVYVGKNDGTLGIQYWQPYETAEPLGFLSEGSIVCMKTAWDGTNYDYHALLINPVNALCRTLVLDDFYSFVNTPYGALMIPRNNSSVFVGLRTVKVLTSPYTPFPHHICCSGYIYP